MKISLRKKLELTALFAIVLGAYAISILCISSHLNNSFGIVEWLFAPVLVLAEIIVINVYWITFKRSTI